MEANLLQQLHHPCVVSFVSVCIQPITALVMEEAPNGSLEWPLIRKIHRIVIHRIATEIAAALRHLHTMGIISDNIKAGNILLWTLDPDSLCHVKLSDLGNARKYSAIGVTGQIGTEGFIAPAFHYLMQLMKVCWEDNQARRPSTDEIISTLCQMPLLSIMCVHPVHGLFPLCHILAITPDDFTNAGIERNSSELWVCCDGTSGAEINIYSTNTMLKVGNNSIVQNQIQCISICLDHVWVASCAGSTS